LAALAGVPAGASALTVTVTTPPPTMSLSHAVTGTTSMVLAVVSPLAYTMTINDSSSTTPGYMDRVNCVTRALLGGSLGNPLQWSSPTTGASGTLSATPQNVVSGASPATVQINFTQTLGATEPVTQGDCYELPVNITVT
jgi:hypothetical protein